MISALINLVMGVKIQKKKIHAATKCKSFCQMAFIPVNKLAELSSPKIRIDIKGCKMAGKKIINPAKQTAKVRLIELSFRSTT